MIDWRGFVDRLRDPGDTLHRGAVAAAIVLTAALALWIVFWLFTHREPTGETARANIAVVDSTVDRTQVEETAAVDDLGDQARTVIDNTNERTARHVATVRAVRPKPAPPGAVLLDVPDDATFDGLCASRLYRRAADCRR